MTVSNGQLGNQTTFNSSFMSREVDTTTIGKVDLNNVAAASGASTVNVQRIVNSLASALGITTSEVYNFLFTYSSNVVGAANDTAFARLNALTLKFRGGVGLSHAHTGVDGSGEKISASDLLNINQYVAEWQAIIKTGVTGTSSVITTQMTGKVSGGGNISYGVITGAPDNKCALFDSVTGQSFEDAGGQKVYGRVTYSAGVWTLTYYTNEAGVETSYNFVSSSSLQVFFLEVFSLSTRPTVPSSPEFGSLDITGDVVDASEIYRGVVNILDQQFLGQKRFAEIGFKPATDAASTGSLTIPDTGVVVTRLTNAALTEIKGINSTKADALRILVNATGVEVLIKHDSAVSPAEGFLCFDSANVTMKPNAVAMAFYDSTSARWRVLGSGGGTAGGSGSSGINYVANGQANSDTTGWVITKNTSAAAIPDSGFVTSGVTNTWTRSTSTPLRGTASFLYTLAALGEQAYYPIDIADADKGKVLQGSFNYAISSGTYADDTVTMWIFDVTNGTFIQGAPYLVKNHTLVSDKMAFEFQTNSTSNSYRLVFHQAAASTAVLKIDDISVGPTAKLYGSPITDWVSYTPTGSWSSNVTYVGKWRRVGDTMEVDTTVTCSGAPTSATYTVNLPTGYTIDAAKIQDSDNHLYGFGMAYDVGVNSYPLVASYSSTTAMGVVVANAAGTYALSVGVTQAVPFTFGNTDRVQLKFSVPITGWSSSVVMSNDANTQVISVSAAPTTGQSIPNSVATKVQFDLTNNNGSKDTNASLDATNYRVIIKTPGLYQISGAINYTLSTATYDAEAYLYVSGVVKKYTTSGKSGTASTSHSVVYNFTHDLIAGDYIEIFTLQTSGGALSIRANNSAPDLTNLSVSKLSGPAQIAASEFIAPTIQKFTAVGTSTYTLPLSPRMPKYLRVRMVGPGGGGGSSDSGAGTSAGNGSASTTFAIPSSTVLLTATAGGGGTNSGVGALGGGSISIVSPAIGTTFGGGAGGGGTFSSIAGVHRAGGLGAPSVFGGGGRAGHYSSDGGAAIQNTGSGGGGAGSAGTINTYSGGGGGSGSFVDAIIPSPLTSYTLFIGTGGAGGTGAGLAVGGAGANGYIEVTEYYS